MQCDGVALNLDQGASLQGLALLNIPYTHGGTNMWGDHLSRKRAKKLRKRGRNEEPNPTANLQIAVQGTKCILDSITDVIVQKCIIMSDPPFSDIGDQLIEVIGLENCLHMGQVRTGLRASGKRLAQCSTVIIRTRKRLPMQIDGEPWMQAPCTVSSNWQSSELNYYAIPYDDTAFFDVMPFLSTFYSLKSLTKIRCQC